MRVEVFAVKGRPIWFFTPYVFELEVKLFTTLDKETLYKSSDLIFQDKLAIEKLLILEYTELNREILNKEMQLKFGHKYLLQVGKKRFTYIMLQRK